VRDQEPELLCSWKARLPLPCTGPPIELAICHLSSPLTKRRASEFNRMNPLALEVPFAGPDLRLLTPSWNLRSCIRIEFDRRIRPERRGPEEYGARVDWCSDPAKLSRAVPRRRRACRRVVLSETNEPRPYVLFFFSFFWMATTIILCTGNFPVVRRAAQRISKIPSNESAKWAVAGPHRPGDSIPSSR